MLGCPALAGEPPVDVRPPLLDMRPPIDVDALPATDVDAVPPVVVAPLPSGDERTTPPQAASPSSTHPSNHRATTPKA